MHLHVVPSLAAAFLFVHFGYSYVISVITTTITFQLPDVSISTSTLSPAEFTLNSLTSVSSLSTTAKAVTVPGSTATTTSNAIISTASSSTSYNGTSPDFNGTIPTLPLTSPELSGLNSLLNLIVSIPDSILQAGDADVTAFYQNMSSCLANSTSAISNAASSLVPVLGSLATAAGSDIASLFGDVTSHIPGAITTVESVFSEGTAGAASVFSKVTAAAASLAHSVETAAPALASDAGAGAASVFSQATAAIPTLLSAIHLRSNSKRNITSTFDTIVNLEACISNSLNTNPIFEIGKCAFDIAQLVLPAAKILRAKSLVEAAGGVVMTVQVLGEAADAASVVKIGGQGVLDVLKEASGISKTVDACKFLV